MPARCRAYPATIHTRQASPCSQGHVLLAQTRLSSSAHARSMRTCVRPSCPRCVPRRRCRARAAAAPAGRHRAPASGNAPCRQRRPRRTCLAWARAGSRARTSARQAPFSHVAGYGACCGAACAFAGCPQTSRAPSACPPGAHADRSAGVHAACSSLDAFGNWQVLLVPLCAAKPNTCQRKA